jgi:hypothetical protein
MNLYRNIATGEFFGTQALAKTAGPFRPVEVPVDKACLLTYLNDFTPVKPESSEPIALPDPPQVIIPPTSEVKVIDYDMTLRECIKHASIRDVAEVVGLFMTQYVNECDEDIPTSTVYTMTCEEKAEEVTHCNAPNQGEDQPVEAVTESINEE